MIGFYNSDVFDVLPSNLRIRTRAEGGGRTRKDWDLEAEGDDRRRQVAVGRKIQRRP